MPLNRVLARLCLVAGLFTVPLCKAWAGECKQYIELRSGKYWAKELGKPEKWVLANYYINVWQSPSPSKGKKVGQMRVGSRAAILQASESDYKVKSPLDGSIGWVGKIQVSRTLWQDTETFKPCTAPK